MLSNLTSLYEKSFKECLKERFVIRRYDVIIHLQQQCCELKTTRHIILCIMMLNRKSSSVLLTEHETRHIMLCIRVDKEIQIVCQEQLLVWKFTVSQLETMPKLWFAHLFQHTYQLFNTLLFNNRWQHPQTSIISPMQYQIYALHVYLVQFASRRFSGSSNRYMIHAFLALVSLMNLCTPIPTLLH